MRTNKNQPSKIQQAVIEAVEARQMFAVTASFSAGVLTITGTSAADNIEVKKDVGNLKVKLDSTHTNTYVYANVTKIVANLGGGSDTFTSNNDVAIKMVVNGGAQNDTITTGAGSDTVHGNAGNDRISGNKSLDVLYGDEGNDTVNGNGGLDEIFDGPGADNYFGGVGTDYFFADLVNVHEADLFDGGDDRDYLSYFGRTTGVRIQPDGSANDGWTDGTHNGDNEHDNIFDNIEILVGTDKEDGIYLSATRNYSVEGRKGADFIQGAAGNETLLGGDGDDWIFGMAGNDSLEGNGGNDSIWGGANNDTIKGGSGVDSMLGEAGNDKIYAKDGVFGEVVSGGSGTDWAQVDGFSFGGTKTPFDVLSSIESYVV